MIGIDTIPNNHIGHNICNFDISLIVNKLEECNLYTTFCTTVKGFVDTMKVAKKNTKKHLKFPIVKFKIYTNDDLLHITLS
jgi:hypothetical protein